MAAGAVQGCSRVGSTESIESTAAVAAVASERMGGSTRGRP